MFARSARIAPLLLFLTPTLSFAAKPQHEFSGFITEVSPGHMFQVGFAEVQWNPGKTQIYHAQDQQRVDEPVDMVVRIGAFVHVDGKFDKKTDRLQAKDVELLSPVPQPARTVDGLGLIEEKPQLTDEGTGAKGTLWVDGYPLQVTPQTKLLAADGKPLDAGRITTNLWARYEASREKDGSIRAESITFKPNAISADEAKYLKGAEPVVVPPNYAKHKAGTIKFHWRWKLKILPDKIVQDYVTRVGESLIPAYQKALPESDPTKVRFRFYVVEKFSMWKGPLMDCEASPGGIVVVPDNVLSVLDNGAQLAALLSNCVEMTLEKQLYFHRKQLKIEDALAIGGVGAYPFTSIAAFGVPIGVTNAIVLERLLLQINEQASRIGLRDMLREGYDIREAPFAWTVAANQDANNPQQYLFHPPALVSSVMQDLYYFYPSVDYSKLMTRREAYHRMLRHLRKAVHKLPKSKNYPNNAKN